MIASLGGIAAIVIAVFFAAGMLGLVFVFFKLAVVLERTSFMIDDVRKETVPLLHEVKGTVEGVNKELDRVDGMMESVGNMVRSSERVVTVVESVVSSPLIKVAAVSAGAARAMRRLRKDRG